MTNDTVAHRIHPLANAPTDRQAAAIEREEQHTAHNYHPLPVVVAEGAGAWVTDVDGRRYLDCLAAYSAVNFGHSNPELLDAARVIVSAEFVRAANAADAMAGIHPQTIVEPGDEKELAAILKLANDEGVAVIPRGGGT